MAEKARHVTEAEWHREGEKLFGTKDPLQWEFVCPVCAYVAKGQAWVDADAVDAIAFSCIGRWQDDSRDAFDVNRKEGDPTPQGPCNYAGGGLFRLNPVVILMENGNERATFEFARRDE